MELGEHVRPLGMTRSVTPPSLVWILIKAHLYGAIVVGVFVMGLPMAASRLDALMSLRLPASFAAVGVPLFAASGALSYASFWTLITRGSGTAFPTDPPLRFVAAGPYRYVRNPMYLGNLGMVFAAALIFRSAGILLYWSLLCVATHWYVAGIEEPRLVERFGASYEAYRAVVRRWRPHGRAAY